MDTEKTTPRWAPAWLKGQVNDGGEKAASTPVVRSSAPAAADGLGDLREQAERLMATFPESWRKEARSWPEPWGSLWADLAEAGEEEGLTPREAEALAYDVFAGQLPTSARSKLDPGPGLADFDRAWSTTADPIFPEMCRGRTRVYAAPKVAGKTKTARKPDKAFVLQEA